MRFEGCVPLVLLVLQEAKSALPSNLSSSRFSLINSTQLSQLVVVSTPLSEDNAEILLFDCCFIYCLDSIYS